MSSTDPFAEALGAGRGRSRAAEWPDADQLALVWERGLIGQPLRDQLRDTGMFSFVKRVALLPEGHADPDAAFYFMDMTPFTDGRGYLVEASGGRRLWVAGELGSDIDDEGFDGFQVLGRVPFSPSAAEERDAIRVWRFEHTPARWRGLVHQGGDEDWVAFVPEHLSHQGYDPEWLVEGRSFGVCTVEIAPVAGGTLHTGCHA